MNHSNYAIKDMTTTTDCYEAVEAIESHHSNYVGGLKSWLSGKETFLTVAAKNKIESLNKKADKLFDQLPEELKS